MLRIGPASYNANNYNVRNNKTAQIQPAFSAKINPEDVIKITEDTGITDIQWLGDLAAWINKRGLDHFLKNNQHVVKEGHEMKPAVEKLIKIAKLDK